MNLNKKVILVGLLAAFSPVHAGNNTNNTNGTSAPTYGTCSDLSNATAVGARACPTNYQYKTSAASSNCAAATCDGSSAADKATCCQAGCVTTACPTNYVNKSTQSSVYCAGATCSLANENGTDISTCCDAQAKCNTFTSPGCNATTHVAKSSADTINCAGSSCAASDSATCCDARAACSTHPCGANYTAKSGAPLCTGLASTCSDSTCCDLKAYCTGFSCTGNQSLKSSPSTIQCSGATCTATECCEVKAKCSSHTCTDTTHVDKTNKATTDCTGTAATTCNDATCCDPKMQCSAHTCGTGLVAKSSATVCTGTLDTTCGSACCELNSNSSSTMKMCRTQDITCNTGDFLKQGDLDLCTGTGCDVATCCTTMSAAADAKVEAAASAAADALAAVNTADVAAAAKAAASTLTGLSPGGVAITIPSPDAIAAASGTGGTVELTGISVSGTAAEAQTAMNKPDFKCKFIDALKIAIDCLVAKLTVTNARRLEGNGHAGDSRRLAQAVKIAIGVMTTQELNDLKAQTVCGSVKASVFASYSCPNNGLFNDMGRCANTTCVATATGDGQAGYCCSDKPLCTVSFIAGATATSGKLTCGASKTVKSADRCAALTCKATDATSCCSGGSSSGGSSGGDAGFAAAAGYAAALLMLLVQ